MRKNIITGVSLVALSAGMAQAGGFEFKHSIHVAMYARGVYFSLRQCSKTKTLQ